jgi:hypothetical protein
MEESTQIVVSYVPLLDDDNTELSQESSKGECLGCIWDDEHNNEITLVIPDARQIAEHFLYWSEDKPQDWFKLHFKEWNNYYALALIPDLSKTLNRFKIKFQLRTGFPFPQDKPVHFYFKPIHFFSKSEKTRQFKDSVRIFLLDPNDVLPTTHGDGLLGQAERYKKNSYRLGEFNISPSSTYLDALFPT